ASLRRDDHLHLRKRMVLADDRVFARLVERVSVRFERHQAGGGPRAVLGGNRVQNAPVVHPSHHRPRLDADAVRIEGVLVDIHAHAAGGVVADVARDLDAEVVGDRAVEETAGRATRTAWTCTAAAAATAGDVRLGLGFERAIQLQRHDAVASGDGDVLLAVDLIARDRRAAAVQAGLVLPDLVAGL